MIGITPKNILRHELMGLNVRIIRATNPSVTRISGVLVDETRNMFTIRGRMGEVMIPKAIATFRFTLPDRTRVDVDGPRLVARPENRLKTKVRRW